MRHTHLKRAWLMLLALPSMAASQFPVAGESLHYTINWPSGLSLGEAHLRAERNRGNWEFEFTVDAAVPGFVVADRYRSLAAPELCSLELHKGSIHGRRKASEQTIFDYRRNVARRATALGGRSEFPIRTCARDALSFIFYARAELAQGRVPPESTVFFGAPYQVKLEYAGAETVRFSSTQAEADRMLISVKGPASAIELEVFYARDATRTPLLVKVPLALGVVSMELVR